MFKGDSIRLLLLILVFVFFGQIFSVQADSLDERDSLSVITEDNSFSVIRADGHAPIGVMGDHMHRAGEWMASYRYMSMDMSGNTDGRNGLSDEEIATTVLNRFSNIAGQPGTLRVVPQNMEMDMHMFGFMYAPSNDITLMLMGSYLVKNMTLKTFRMATGTTVLGNFSTKTEGFGDVKISVMRRLVANERHSAHINLGISLPNGSTTEDGTVLTPMNQRPLKRLPYAMQLGSGTKDLVVGITYSGKLNDIGWGVQYSGVIRTGKDQGYSWGDKHSLTAWGSKRWSSSMSYSLRLVGESMGQINGIDPNIVLPTQAADPANYGGEVLSTYIGFNWVGQEGLLRGHRIALELGMPFYQDLNVPQMETNKILTIGWQRAW